MIDLFFISKFESDSAALFYLISSTYNALKVFNNNVYSYQCSLSACKEAAVIHGSAKINV